MAKQDVEFNIGTNVQGVQDLDALARELDELGKEAGESSPEVAALFERLRDITSQQNLIDQFRRQKAAVQGSADAMKEAKRRTGELARQIKATENPTRTLEREFERSRKTARKLAESYQTQRVGLQRMRDRMREAGVSTAHLADHQRRLHTDVRQTQTEITGLRSRLSAAGGAAESAGRRISGGFNRAAQGARTVSDQIVRAKNSLIAFAAATGAIRIGRQLAQTADQYNQISARVRQATDSQADYNLAQNELFRIAQDTRSSLATNAALFARTADAVKRLGGNTSDTLQLTELITKGLRLSGATAEETASAQLQLSQALGSGVLRGDEFNSVMEASPRLVKALADGLGQPVGKLRELAAEGELTSQRVIEALQSQKATIDREFADLPVTIGGALQQVENQWLKLIGVQDQSAGASKQVAEAIQLFADNLDSVLATAVTVGNAATIAARTVTAAVFQMAATVAKALDTLTLGTIDGLHAQAQALSDTVKGIQQDISRDFTDIQTAWEGVGEAAKKTNEEIEAGANQATGGLNKTGEAAEQAKAKLETVKEEAGGLSDALQTLNVDAQQVATGVRTAFGEMAGAFGEVVKGFDAGNPVIAASAKHLADSAKTSQEVALAQETLKAALDAGKLSAEGYAKAIKALSSNLATQAIESIKSAESSEQLQTALDNVQKLYRDGVITAQQYRDALVEVKNRMNELAGGTEDAAGATENLNRSTRDATQALNESTEATDKQGKSLERASGFASTFNDMLRSIYDSAASLSQGAADSLAAIDPLFAKIKKSSDEAGTATTRLKKVLEEIRQARFLAPNIAPAGQFSTMLRDAARHAREIRLRFAQQAVSAEDLSKRVGQLTERLSKVSVLSQEANRYFQQNLDVARGTVESFDKLDEATLDQLRAQIQRAQDQLGQLRAEADAARESLNGIGDQLQDELDRIEGNRQAIEQRRFAEQLQRIEELEQRGGEVAAREAERARRLAEQLHQKKLADIRKEAEERQRAAAETAAESGSTSVTDRPTGPATEPRPQVAKVIRLDIGSGRSIDVPASQEQDLLDLLEQFKRVS
ncbi:tape measure protein [Methylohalobius crimeensis]|uniref:tape measure protein n=1 Tax=Methylohalobius crimeensis TaxID=244365 RepID=UPI0003B5E532|nr:tape measure protein [Methylohalobius crimeensis]